MNSSAMIERFLQVKLGQTTADGAITLEAVYCLGICALSPAVMVDDKLVGRVDAAKFERSSRSAAHDQGLRSARLRCPLGRCR